MIVREYSKLDGKDVMPLFEHLLDLTPDRIINEDYAKDKAFAFEDDFVDSHSDSLYGDDRVELIALAGNEDENKVVGFLQAWKESMDGEAQPHWEVESFYVSAAMDTKEVALAMLKYLQDLPPFTSKTLCAMVHSKAEYAIEFWKSIGYVRRPEYETQLGYDKTRLWSFTSPLE